MYKAGLPINAPVDASAYYKNFEAELRNFWTNGSYYCVFAGLGVLPGAPLPSLPHRPSAAQEAKLLFKDVKHKQHEMIRDLPTTVEYLRTLHNK